MTSAERTAEMAASCDDDSAKPNRAGAIAAPWKHALISLVLFGVVIAVFWPATSAQFIMLDDESYVVKNYQVQQGLTPKSIRWALTTGECANWHPLTWLSLMLDYEVFGLQPFGFHLTSVLLHAANASLLYLVLLRMTGQAWHSALAAAIFALHPLRVESVAWVSERKDVLSALFGFLALGAYAHYAAAPSVKRYALVVAAYVLSLLAKPMLVTFPMLLMLLDYWPLRRWSFDRVAFSAADSASAVSPNAAFPPRSLTHLILEKLPLLAIAVASSAVTFLVQSHGSAVTSLRAVGLGQRLANAAVAYARYLEKMVRFDQLAVFYPLHTWPSWQVTVASLVLSAVTLTVLWRLRRSPWLAVGWFWYLGMLIPVIGIVKVGEQAMADRYTYLPTIGIVLMVVWSLPKRLFATPRGRAAAGTVGLAIIAVLIMSTRTQLSYWQNSKRLFEHALAVTRDNYVINTVLGDYLFLEEGDTESALKHFGQALQIRPTWWPAYIDRGVLYRRQGQLQKAIREFDRAIELESSPNVYYGRGITYEKLGDLPRALADFSKAIELSPGFAEAYHKRAGTYAAMRAHEKAIRDFSEVLQLRPNVLDAYLERARQYEAVGRFEQAVSDLDSAISLQPDHAAYLQRGNLYLRSGRPGEAVEDFSRAAQLKPEVAETYYGRGMARLQMQKFEQAIQDFDEATSRQKDYVEAVANRGLAYLRMGNHRLALLDLNTAIELKPQEPALFQHRAVAYLGERQYDLAWQDVETCRKLGGEPESEFLRRLAEASGRPQ